MLTAKLVRVFGNNDGDHEFLRKRSNECPDCEIRGRFTEINAEGFKTALLHGDDKELLNALINCGGFDTVVHGHSHVTISRKNEKTLIVNPGEVCAYLTERAIIVLLDTIKREVEIAELHIS